MCVVGDFTEQDMESCLLDYLGTVTPNDHEQLRSGLDEEKPVLIDPNPPTELRHQQVRVPCNGLDKQEVAIYHNFFTIFISLDMLS